VPPVATASTTGSKEFDAAESVNVMSAV